MSAIVKFLVAATCCLIFAEPASAQMVMSNEPPPGQLAAGEVIYVSCGPGKARKVTGGSNMGPGGQPIKGGGRTRGPCVAMKN
jgi:hypothetical protein